MDVLEKHYTRFGKTIDDLDDDCISSILRSTNKEKSLLYGSVLRDICAHHGVNIKNMIDGSKTRRGIKINICKLKDNDDVWRDVKTFAHFLADDSPGS